MTPAPAGSQTDLDLTPPLQRTYEAVSCTSPSLPHHHRQRNPGPLKPDSTRRTVLGNTPR